MSREQLKAYFETEDAAKDIVKNAREKGYDVSDEDLVNVDGGSTLYARFEEKEIVELRQQSGEDAITIKTKDSNNGKSATIASEKKGFIVKQIKR